MSSESGYIREPKRNFSLHYWDPVTHEWILRFPNPDMRNIVSIYHNIPESVKEIMRGGKSAGKGIQRDSKVSHLEQI